MNYKSLSVFLRTSLMTAVLTGGLGLAPAVSAKTEAQYDPGLYQAMKWRNIGPYRGGRVTAVAGIPDNIHTYYMGATGGGLWKTENSGVTWSNISDGFFNTGSIGAITVAPSDPNVIYVGTGEVPIRGVATTHGDGVYKSTDAGKTWTHMGFKESRQISRIWVHPTNADLVYMAVQGNPWGPSKERGVYKSTDGAKTWKQILFVNEDTGATDLVMDETNSRVLYAAMWDHRRQPWYVRSGGKGSSIHKSTDGGETWKRLEGGLPKAMGKMGVAVSPVDPSRVYAVIEADKGEGGLYRSDNGGETWKLMNSTREIQTRSWYYMHIFPDTQNADTVYVLNSPFMKSIDGGKTFTRVKTPHVDNHDLWINPHDNRIMINGNDGGANVSHNGGKTWSMQYNQPTAQFYRVITDNLVPYNVYGSQQDNSTVAIASQSAAKGIGNDSWLAVGGGESAHIGMNPDDPALVYASNILGGATEFNRETKQTRSIRVYPETNFSVAPKDLKYRFNWNTPLIVSPHDPTVIYKGAQVVLKSTDRGVSWQEVSPDLTRNDKTKQGPGGFPYTNEQVTAETYNTVFYLAESPHQQGTIWAGTDDGLVHLTRDGGENWQNITPPRLAEGQINSIEVSPHDAATAYVVWTGYKMNDFSPHIYKTSDYGKSWKKIADGLPGDTFVRVVREDPARPGLLYAGTEAGMFVSFNDGKSWQTLQLNLPKVPVTDLTIRQNDLIASTQGRAFWILDDLAPLHQLDARVAATSAYLYKPNDAWHRISYSGDYANYAPTGENPAAGAVIYYYLKDKPAEGAAPLSLEILDGNGHLVRRMTSKDEAPCSVPTAEPAKNFAPTTEKGMNRWVWDLKRSGFPCFAEVVATRGSLTGFRVAPGNYKVRLTVNGVSQTQDLAVIPDPRMKAEAADFAAYDQTITALSADLHDMLTRLQALRKAKDQLALLQDLTADASLKDRSQTLAEKYSAWEQQIVQLNHETFQDAVSFPPMLAGEIAALLDEVDEGQVPVQQGAKEHAQALQGRWQTLKAEFERLRGEDTPAFNAAATAAGLPAVYLPVALP